MPRWERIRAAAVLVALGLCVVMVLLLSREDRHLRRQVVDMAMRVIEPYRGLWLPTFTTATLAGEPQTIGETSNGRHQVLFVFTTSCPYCKQMVRTWGQLASELGRVEPQPDVLGLSLDSADSTRAYVLANHVPYPVARFPNTKLAHLYRTRSVPLTLVLDDSGRVLYSRLGVLDSHAALDSVRRAATPPARSSMSIAAPGAPGMADSARSTVRH